MTSTFFNFIFLYFFNLIFLIVTVIQLTFCIVIKMGANPSTKDHYYYVIITIAVIIDIIIIASIAIIIITCITIICNYY